MSAIRQSARGETCQVRYPGVCTHDSATVILSHYRGSAGGKGLSLKSIDEASAYCCTACDACYDGQAPRPGFTKEQADLWWLQGHMRTLVILKEKGLL